MRPRPGPERERRCAGSRQARDHSLLAAAERQDMLAKHLQELDEAEEEHEDTGMGSGSTSGDEPSYRPPKRARAAPAAGGPAVPERPWPRCVRVLA